MATTTEDLKNSQDAFSDAFNEEDVAKREPTEDEAFGLDVEEAAAKEAEEGSADGVPIDAVVVVADGDGVEKALEDEVAAVTSAEAAESASQESADDEPTDPKEIQRKRSWEGRLRAEEARLKEAAAELAKKAAETQVPVEEVASDALSEAASQAGAEGDVAMAEKVDKVAEQVEDGDISVDEAVKILSEDFGEPFVNMIAAIAKSYATKAAGEKVGELEKSTTDIIDHLKSQAAREHFKAIEAEHADFAELGKDPAFIEWKAQDPERDRIASGGSAAEINSMLTAYKSEAGGQADEPTGQPAQDAAEMVAAAPAQAPRNEPDEVADDELDAAEGVRSAGMQLPEEPAAADDYAGAWEEFAEADKKA